MSVIVSSRLIALLLALAWAPVLRAETYTRPPLDVDLIGAIRSVEARHEDTLLDIARRYDVGQDEIVIANPGVDRWLPQPGARVVVPSRYILPRADRKGLVLNVAEMRLYYFPLASPGQPGEVQTYPVSVGRMDWTTPVGVTRVVAKTRNPDWHPPESIRLEAAARGDPLPDVIPSGPNNPLGNYALRMALPGYLIHSTNKPYGVGMRVTHGCVRMYPEDIEVLFPEVPVGTPVQIVNQPVKLGWLADTLFIEVHPPLEEDQAITNLKALAMDLVNREWERRPFVLDGAAFNRAVSEKHGIPVAIARAARD
ncbi:MAG: L,D-transpeptidase family protein [Thiogranum sp.]